MLIVNEINICVFACVKLFFLRDSGNLGENQCKVTEVNLTEDFSRDVFSNRDNFLSSKNAR